MCGGLMETAEQQFLLKLDQIITSETFQSVFEICLFFMSRKLGFGNDNGENQQC